MSPGYEKSKEGFGMGGGVESGCEREGQHFAEGEVSRPPGWLLLYCPPLYPLSLKTQCYLSLSVLLESKALGAYLKLEREGKLLAAFLSLC